MMYELGKTDDVRTNSIQSLFDLQPASMVALTGAGISVRSGLPLGDAVVGGIRLPEFFRRWVWKEIPEKAFDAYRVILSEWRTSAPNTSHRLLAEHKIPIITQNIDGLHRDAGSQQVIELHGNLRELRCPQCGGIFSSQIVFESVVPKCPTCAHMLYPGFTLEGEPVRHIARAAEWISSCDTVLIIGTQLSMHPVRSLREMARRQASNVIWIADEAETWLSLILGWNTNT